MGFKIIGEEKTEELDLLSVRELGGNFISLNNMLFIFLSSIQILYIAFSFYF